ncbi:Thioredoxin Y, chloroplastic [Apostasia shenzhenica]|uniref:Thioredoxin Y, chloroplastic n=1 Tax=Apostasia shenzhenica TaxID=1088818 RepID=A0A2H9ZUN9_9ASPA|nr:Thioredoxin Y, chloroplastic [Apostasia shenzhenica]
MAAYSAAAAVSSCHLHRSLAADSSGLAVSLSIRATHLRCFPANSRRLSALPQRRITPKVEAKKQSFSSFDDLLENSDKPVLVDFYATWCGPCQFMVPVLEQVGQKLKDKIRVVKIDTEKYTKIADRYRIEALPTLIIFRDGKPCDRLEGAVPAEQLIKRIENALKVPQ